jgi:hypothetical protein
VDDAALWASLRAGDVAAVVAAVASWAPPEP